jgi:hypothetical protein
MAWAEFASGSTMDGWSSFPASFDLHPIKTDLHHEDFDQLLVWNGVADDAPRLVR